MHRLVFVGTVLAVSVMITFAPAGAAPPAAPNGASALAHRAARSLAAPAPTAKAHTAKTHAARAHATNHLAVTISSSCAGFCFAPASMTISVGDTVTWVNRTGAQHNVTRCNPAACNGASAGTGTDASFTAGNVASASGATFSHTFRAPGTYVYYCTIHGYALMHGTITVTAAATTTTAAAPATVPAPGAPTPPPPRLANTGATTGTATTLAVFLIAGGLATGGLQRRSRRRGRVR